MSEPKWNRDLEVRYSDIASEISEMEAARSEALRKVSEALHSCFDEYGDISAILAAENADALRDALEPFDSGVRPAGKDA